MSNEKILISGILAHPVGAELALSLSQQCGARHIVGLIEHLLSVEQSRRLEFLLQKLPKLKIYVSRYPLSDSKMQRLLEWFMPTIIYHFEPLSTISETEIPGIFARQTSLEQLSRICRAVARGIGLFARGPRVIYINPSRLSGSSGLDRIILSMRTTALQTFRLLFGIEAVQLNLPSIYGPFQEGAVLLGLNETTDEYLKSPQAALQPLIHISDAVVAIIVSSRVSYFNTTDVSPPILSAPATKRTTLAMLLQIFNDIHRRNKKAIANAGKIYPILSWYYHQTTPHSSNFSMLPNKQATIKALGLISKMLHKGKVTLVSQLERRQHNLFPCVSECARQSLSCRSSVWKSTISISKNSTRGCKYLLYTANFSESLLDLPEVMVSVNNASWPRDLFCQVAFVSSQSSLVNQVFGTKSNVTYENGKAVRNGWRLVAIDGNDKSLSEADYIMPKIAPSKLFSASVDKAAYLEPQQMTSLPPLQILCFLMAKRMDARSVPARMTSREGHKLTLPPVPEKHIMFVGHTFDFDDADLPFQSSSEYMVQLAKAVLHQKGKLGTHEGQWPTRQLLAYTKSIQWQQEQELSFEPVDTYLLVHNLRYKQSRRLRCHWYEEQLFWESQGGHSSRDLEDLSLSYVIHRWRRQQWLDTSPADESEDRWGERLLVETQRETNSSVNVYVKLHQRMKARRIY
jgi:hypothetical protein